MIMYIYRQWPRGNNGHCNTKKNNNKGDDLGITTGCRLEDLRTKSELDGSKQDNRDIVNIGSMDYVQTR